MHPGPGAFALNYVSRAVGGGDCSYGKPPVVHGARAHKVQTDLVLFFHFDINKWPLMLIDSSC
jgi:hypothetical protein